MPRARLQLIVERSSRWIFSSCLPAGVSGYEPSYRTINRFRVDPEAKELLHQCFVQPFFTSLKTVLSQPPRSSSSVHFISVKLKRGYAGICVIFTMGI
ncbi:hypothetical protein EBO34_05140 [Alteribacter keqinensis]|uniref:Uncharacterized protein n=1 Tax=Alteribacter keqinensis TaxID=2483800 RepID=A0A3M7TUL0_9BACI|nr:hypothetical protein EBO34_05140 [Alteribacter keqinensis]